MKLEILEKDKVYHIYNRGINSETIFISDKPTKLLREEVIQLFDSKDNFIYCHDFKNEILSEKHLLE
jgi:hypothetical protein